MENKAKRSRARIVAVGALVGTIMSIGAIAGAASAQGSDTSSDDATATSIQASFSDGGGWGFERMTSGIRW